MKIAIPTSKGYLFKHFGQSPEFTVFEVDEKSKEIQSSEIAVKESHVHGFPHWLLERNIDLIIAGGIGQGAIENLNRLGVGVVVGAPQKKPDELINTFLDGKLVTSNDPCNHDHQGHEGHQCNCHKQ